MILMANGVSFDDVFVKLVITASQIDGQPIFQNPRACSAARVCVQTRRQVDGVKTFGGYLPASQERRVLRKHVSKTGGCVGTE